ncbi:MAG: phosphoribosylformylglycinamidine synthase subunit PurS [Chloroflexi bacterium]|nr:phosphoribosylformylglycinamidine synthase subunit PurS [Chloroflexota bacterium]
MSTFTAEVRVMLKPSVNDPQGLSIRSALHTLGFDAVSEVRAGKLIALTLDAADEAAAMEAVRQMADKLLANPVIETFEVRLLEAAAPAT